MTGSNIEQTNKTKRATDPYANIAVFASAGSGKTYLLVHRILKLLLNGVEPAHILAITFTRKAAAEMQERLMKVLAEWASADDSQLETTLKDLSHSYNNASIAKARKLYEELLFAEHEIRITTFHAFCQDILKRFAIHAGVPAGFRVTENTLTLKQEARKRLFKLAQSEKHEKLNQTLFKLLDHCNSVNNIHQVLDTFLDSRSDWWSFTENQTDPTAYAEQCLHKLLFNKPFDQAAFITTITPLTQEYSSYLFLHQTATNQRHGESLSRFLEQPDIQHLNTIFYVFLTRKFEKRQLKTGKALEKSLGTEKMHKFLVLHETICEQLLEYIDYTKKQALFEFNQAWYYAGKLLLDEYQSLKFNQHTLDFDDLEWYTYLLLNQHESAAWVQYKLDQRIQHILIDEFQDTNPTQWKLLLPLLDELAIDAHDNHRSLFFVGDAKQSIYGFRRANSKLQFTAADWAKQHLNADLLETDDSYRSSPAIIKFVNQIFSQEKIELSNFNSHCAIQSNLWGEVHVEPLISIEDLGNDKAKQTSFRNPLIKGKQDIEYDCHFIESQQVAKKITRLVNSTTSILSDSGARTIEYRDIMILARNRTHLAQLELALREQRIPYNSTYDKDFLSSLEVQDILALLTYLVQTHNDLALAQVLRSPLYAISDEEMMQIAMQKEPTWHEKLETYSKQANNSIARQAVEQLESWRKIANSLPVHDLLDQIYFQTNLLTRYSHCISNEGSEELKIQVLENLTSLLQLSLDLDAGRYSSIQSFLQALQNPNASSSLSSNKPQQSENAVQIMTIHSAKGLEAPVVFLIDTGPQKSKPRTYQSIINWPPSAQQPEQFFILGRKDDIDKDTQAIIKHQTNKDYLEELNLLYVALTRAKQYLFVSGTASKHNTFSWHSIIQDAFEKADDDEPLEFSFGTPTTAKKPNDQTSTEGPPELDLNFDLSLPFPITDVTNPSTEQLAAIDEQQADYGTLVHKILELAEQKHFQNQDYEELKFVVDTALGTTTTSQEFDRALDEVKNCLETPKLHELFSEAPGKEILKEIPISFTNKDNVFYRIIDLLIITDSTAWVIDYKTTSDVAIETMQEHAKQYLNQINTYRNAVTKLYPEKAIRASILFTSIPAQYDFSEEELIN